MYSKFGNIYMTSNMDFLPIKELKISDHIILLQPPDHHHSVGSRSVNMILKEIKQECLYVFDSMTVYSSYNENEVWSEETDTEESVILRTEVENVSIDTESGIITYLWVEKKNTFVHLDKVLHRHVAQSSFNVNQPIGSSYYKDEVRAKITTGYMPEFPYSEHSRSGMPNQSFNYISLPISSQAFIVFEVILNTTIATYQWEMDYGAWIYTTDGTVTDLHTNITSLIETFIGLFDTTHNGWSKFLKAYELLPKKFAKALANNYYFGYKSPLEDILKHSSIPKDVVERFHTPIYENKTTEFAAYIEKSSVSIVCTVKDSVVSAYDIEYNLKNEDIKADYVRAEALCTFYKKDWTGIHPQTGILYIQGEMVSEDEHTKFECAEGIIAKYEQRAYTAVKVHDYFVDPGYKYKELETKLREQVELAEQLIL